MGFWEFALALILAIAGGSAGAAVVNSINERWKFKANRKAKKEDEQEAREDRTDEIQEEIIKMKAEEKSLKETHNKDMSALTKQMDAQSEALRLLLLDRILVLGQEYIDQEEISFDDRKRFHKMHECYHTSLNGNGDADLVVKGVDALPLKTQ